MKRTKLISDFDGIWTNQAIEAKYVWDYINSSLCELANLSTDEIEQLMSGSKSQMDREAHKYGWYNGSAVAAFYQEDPYGDNNAIFDFIDKTADTDPKLKNLKGAILKKNSSLAEFSQKCFAESTTKFKNDGKLVAVETTAQIVKDLNAMGVEIIVVSNSKTEKIKYLFSNAGVEVSDDESPTRKGVHARGDAQKYVIDNSYTELPEYLKVTDKFSVPLRRSKYHKVLSEEKPDFVIGDVFSLDIALPLYLRMNDSSPENLSVIQRVQAYTPGWVKDFLKQDQFKGIAYMVDSVDDAPDLISKIKSN